MLVEINLWPQIKLRGFTKGERQMGQSKDSYDFSSALPDFSIYK